MFRRASVALVLLVGVFLTVLSPGVAVADATADAGSGTTVATGTPASRADDAPPVVPDGGRPAEVSPQTSLPDTGRPTWAFAVVGAALMLTGTVFTLMARRGNRKHG